MKLIFCVAIALMALANSEAATRCRSSKCNVPPVAACGKVFSVGFTNAEKNEIVNKHNQLRAYVANGLEKRGRPGPQPGAQSMPKMVWDDQLACVAQKWANQCNFAHDPCRDDDRFYVGQNIATTMTTGTVSTTPSDIVQMWYNEVSKMDKNQVPRLTNIGEAGHYTQVVWAKTTKVGCGKIVYQSSDQWKKYFVVCNYGPGGNVMTQPIYEIRH